VAPRMQCGLPWRPDFRALPAPVWSPACRLSLGPPCGDGGLCRAEASDRVLILPPSPCVTGASPVLLLELSDGAADSAAGCACKAAVPPSTCRRRGREGSVVAGGAWLGPPPLARTGASTQRFGAAPPKPPCSPMCVHHLLLVLHLVGVVVA
jgi:hypothetical protein